MKHLEFVSLPREKLQVKDDASSFSEQNINSKEARTEDAVDQKRRNTKRRDTAAQSTRSQKQEEKTNREAAETKKQSALPPEVSHLY